LSSLRKNNIRRGLLIAATGSGKSIFSALHIKEYDKKQKVLFIVHNRTIIQHAIADYRKVLTDCKILELYNHNLTELATADIIFTTPKTALKLIDITKQDYFDLIIIDEAHRSAANQHLDIINYFTPQFLLGMTATPERMDNSDKIFDIFHHQIIYEIRINEALENELIAPFNYFGIGTDLQLNKLVVNRNTEQLVAKIIDDIEKYGYDGDSLHCLIFVNTNSDAMIVAKALNRYYDLQVADVTFDKKESDVAQLLAKFKNGEIKFIVSVDKFNEGIDIPEINLIIFLRSTGSKVVFLQQLGRGLRKIPFKTTRVFDYIGNYQSNYVALEALSGTFSSERRLTTFLTAQNNDISRYIDLQIDKIAIEKI